MTLGLLEAAVTALDTYIQAQFDAKVTALNTEYGDSLLSNMKTYYYGALPKAIPEYPCCAIIGESWEAIEQRGVNIHVQNNIVVVIFVADDNEETRFKKLCRYARGVVEMLDTGETSYGYEHFIAGEIALSEIFTGAEPFIQAVGVPCSLHKLESY